MTFVLKFLGNFKPVHLSQFEGAESKYECPQVSKLHVLPQKGAYSSRCVKPTRGNCAQTAHAQTFTSLRFQSSLGIRLYFPF